MAPDTIYLVTIWVLPVIIAITFHEAAHGFVAHLLGDDTAWRLGRVSFNPVRHIDPFGTILLPGAIARSDGWGKPQAGTSRAALKRRGEPPTRR